MCTRARDILLQKQEEAAPDIVLGTLKSRYNRKEDTVYLIVEGADDLYFYTHICRQFLKPKPLQTFVAGNRKGVIYVYNNVDWTSFSRNRVFFFVDKDLTDILEDKELFDITNEQICTPQASNFHVTDSYSIENLLFTQDTLITAIDDFYSISLLSNSNYRESLSEDEKNKISSLYKQAHNDFLHFFIPIMSWTLYFMCNNIKSNLDGHILSLFEITLGKFKIKDGYHNTEKVVDFMHDKCNVSNYNEYSRPADIDQYTCMIEKRGGIERNIRGKYLKIFFLNFLKSIKTDYPKIFPERSSCCIKSSINIEKYAITSFLGCMKTPPSLFRFMSQQSTLSENQ